MKTKGFTLIELLAVIVILAIIALIATPIILNIINDAREQSTLRSAELYLKSVELAVMKKNLTSSFTPTTCDIVSNGDLICGEETVDVEVEGSVPTSGVITFENNVIVSYKNLYIDEKYVSSSDEGSSLSEEAVKQLATLCIPVTAETVTTGNIPSGNYANGDEYICEVKNGTLYHFFVIGKTDSGEINLMADRNMKAGGVPATTKEDSPSWISVSDYNNDLYPKVDSVCNAADGYTCYNAGPITALNYLDLIVESWTNLPLKDYVVDESLIWGASGKDYTLTLEPDTESYPGYKIVRNTRGRLITVQEANNNGCKFEYDETVDGVTTKYNVGSCPLYMINYTQFKDSTSTSDSKYDGKTSIDGIRGYWTSSVQSVSSTTGNCAVGIHDNAAINCAYTVREQYYGIRPVITLSTSDLG